jgi:hypothetical protein
MKSETMVLLDKRYNAACLWVEHVMEHRGRSQSDWRETRFYVHGDGGAHGDHTHLGFAGLITQTHLDKLTDLINLNCGVLGFPCRVHNAAGELRPSWILPRE